MSEEQRIKDAARWAELSNQAAIEHERQQALSLFGERALRILAKAKRLNSETEHEVFRSEAMHSFLDIRAAARVLGLLDGKP